jgi:hypothetical protein
VTVTYSEPAGARRVARSRRVGERLYVVVVSCTLRGRVAGMHDASRQRRERHAPRAAGWPGCMTSGAVGAPLSPSSSGRRGTRAGRRRARRAARSRRGRAAGRAGPTRWRPAGTTAPRGAGGGVEVGQLGDEAVGPASDALVLLEHLCQRLVRGHREAVGPAVLVLAEGGSAALGELEPLGLGRGHVLERAAEAQLADGRALTCLVVGQPRTVTRRKARCPGGTCRGPSARRTRCLPVSPWWWSLLRSWGPPLLGSGVPTTLRSTGASSCPQSGADCGHGLDELRTLQLLSLLAAPAATGGRRPGRPARVSVRTLRRDVDRLRELGYPVQAARGRRRRLLARRGARCRRWCWTTTSGRPRRRAARRDHQRRDRHGRGVRQRRWRRSCRSCRRGCAAASTPCGP